MIYSSILTLDLQLGRVGQVPFWVRHMTFIHSWNISCDRSQRQGPIEHLKWRWEQTVCRSFAKRRLCASHRKQNKAVNFKETSKLQLLKKIIKYLIKILPHFNFFMFLNWALIFMPDNSWSRVAMGSTAESQRFSKKNFHKSWWCLNKHRWSYNKEISCFFSFTWSNSKKKNKQTNNLSILNQ